MKENLALDDNELVRMKFENCASRTAILLKNVLYTKPLRSVKTVRDKKMEDSNNEEYVLMQTLLPLLGKELAILQSLGVSFEPVLSKDG